MEHISDWLIVLAKALHFPFLAGWHINLKDQEERSFPDIGNLGDNVPYVFLK